MDNVNKDNMNENEIDLKLLNILQEKSPWLVRSSVDDVDFARILEHLLFFIPLELFNVIEEDEKYSMDNIHAFIKDGMKIYMGKNSNSSSPLYGYFVLWMRNLCLINNIMYYIILSETFNEIDVIKEFEIRKAYVSKRLLPLGIYDSQINDIYFILKGYYDAMFSIAENSAHIVRTIEKSYGMSNCIVQAKIIAEEYNHIYPPTETMNMYYSIEDIRKIYFRDYFCGINPIEWKNH